VSEKLVAVHKVLLPLTDAAAALSMSPKQLSRLAALRDIGHVEFDGELYFRVESLREWAQRNESRVW
jgi:hypothetical protein